ncbi:SHOCT domain-containing protein [Streptomyces sp. 142MFCol3.1]|uniref:SHOCT domain-containing protein n=1 Tax=Streptomyces sp. 142MFCol3.1 TaxID=1172179 RepID=UPI000415C43E|nr:SHOCT domain-containing protein [Streptomyces sp. 142MFCol3.1]
MTVNGWIMGWMWIWPVFTVAGLLLIGFVAVRQVQGGLASPPAPRSVGSAAWTLDERRARGEIDEDEYGRRRRLP